MGRSIKFSSSSMLVGIDNSIASGNEQNDAILIGKMCISETKYGKTYSSDKLVSN